MTVGEIVARVALLARLLALALIWAVVKAFSLAIKILRVCFAPR